MVLSKTFCILPWMHFYFDPRGNINACCVSEGNAFQKNGRDLNVAEDSFDDILDSEEFMKMRQQMLRGEWSERCKQCMVSEAAGHVSKRMRDNDKYQDLIPFVNNEEHLGVHYMAISLGNLCNLKCRICGSHSSSAHAQEQFKFTQDPDAKKAITEGKRVPESETFWEEFESVIPDLIDLEFYGGEPFLIAKHFDILKMCVERGYSRKIKIHYNTNGTIFPKEVAQEIWPHFRSVSIHFSIDDMYHRFEYNRFPAKWNEVRDNIMRFRDTLQPRHKNSVLTIAPTQSIFTIKYLAEQKEWCEKEDLDFWINELYRPVPFCISTLPLEVKERLYPQLENDAEKHGDMFKNFINYMKDHDTSDKWDEFKRRVNKYDLWRAQSFRDTFPELMDLFGDYGDGL